MTALTPAESTVAVMVAWLIVWALVVSVADVRRGRR